MSNRVPVTVKPPWYRHPMRMHGLMQTVLGLCLLGLGIHAYSEAKLQVDVTLKNASLQDLGGLFGAVSGNPFLAVKIGGPLLVALIGGIASLTHLVVGIGRITQPDDLSRAPKHMENPKEVVEALLSARVPSGRSAEGDSFFQFIRSNFTGRVDHVPKSYRSLLRDYLGFFVTIVIILAGLFLLSGQVLQLGTYESVGKLYIELPFAGTLMGVLLVVAALRFTCAALLMHKVPGADVLTSRQTFTAAGHPRTVMEELRGALSRVCGGRVGEVLDEEDLQMDQDPMSDVGRARGSIIVESKPEPTSRHSAVTYWLGFTHSIIGALLILVGLVFMLKLSSVSSELAGFNLGPPIMIIFVGLLAFYNGGQFFENAVSLLQRCTYRSSIYAIELKGTVYRSEVGTGMSETDSFRSSSVAVRSEIFIDYAVANCVSEGFGGEGRRLLELQVNDDVRRALKELKKTVEGSDKRNVPILGIPLRDSEEVADIARANAAVSDQRAATEAMHQQEQQHQQALHQQQLLQQQQAFEQQQALLRHQQQQAPASTPFQTATPAANPMPSAEAQTNQDPRQIPDVSTAFPDVVPVQVFPQPVSLDPASQPGAANFAPAQGRRHVPSAASTDTSGTALPSPNVPQLPGRTSGPVKPSDLPQEEGIPASVINRPRATQPLSATSHGFPPLPTNNIPATMVHQPGMVLAPQDALSLIQAQPSKVPETSATPTSEGDTKVCPDCAETIKRAAIKCRFCGLKFDPPA